MNADKIVDMLRACSKGGLCSACPLDEGELDISCIDKLMIAAIDLIESLQAQLADYHHMEQLVDGKMAENQRLRQINEKLQTKLSASRRMEKSAVEDINFERMCHTCKHFLREFGMGGIECKMPCATIWHENFEWRGAKEQTNGTP